VGLESRGGDHQRQRLVTNTDEGDVLNAKVGLAKNPLTGHRERREDQHRDRHEPSESDESTPGPARRVSFLATIALAGSTRRARPGRRDVGAFARSA
jgi:hypothetical protein